MPFGLSKLKGEKGIGTDPYPTEKHENIAPPAGRPRTKEAPPSYADSDPIPPEQVAELNSAFATLNLSTQNPDFPKADQCLAHLKLLSAFYALKEDVGYTDNLFGLADSRCEMLEGQKRDEAFAKIREKRWLVYVVRAVERFEEWWIKVLCPREGGRRLLGKEMLATNSEFMSFTQKGRPQLWTVEMLPPLGKWMMDLCYTLSNYARRPHGMARVHAQSSKLPRRLRSFRIERPLGYRHALGRCQ